MSKKLSRRTATMMMASSACTLAAPSIIVAQTRQKVPFAMGAGAFYFTLHYVSEAGGLYAQEGYDLDSVNVSSGPRQVASIMGGSADVAPLGLQLVVTATQRGGNIIAVCAGYNILPMSILLSNDAISKAGITDGMSTDEKVRRMKGLRIGITTPGSGTDDMVRAVLRARGMNPDRDITIQPLVTAETMLASLERGSSDGFCFTSPIPEYAISKGWGKIILEPLNGDVPEAANVPYIIMATSPDVIKNKRPQLVAMVRCWTKAMDIVRDNPREASALVRRYFPDMDDAIYNAAFEKYRKGVPTSPMVVNDQLEKLLKFMQISKGTPMNATLADVFHPGIAEEVIKATGRRS
jgi:NitT/TauT family transport system substrate-binding protein